MSAVQLERAPRLRSASWSPWTPARGQRRLQRRSLSRSGPSSGRALVGLDRANTPQEGWRCQLRSTRARETRFLYEPALNVLDAFRDPGAGIYAEAGSSPRVAVADQARCGHTGGLGGRRVPTRPRIDTPRPCSRWLWMTASGRFDQFDRRRGNGRIRRKSVIGNQPAMLRCPPFWGHFGCHGQLVNIYRSGQVRGRQAGKAGFGRFRR